MNEEVLWRVLAAAALGGVIGAEREIAGQQAGLRTHATVAIGACLFGIVSTLGFEEFFMRRELTNIQVDVTRVASNVVVGIGFLGAGLIFRRGADVKNLTTAASLWATAAVGLACGVGNMAFAGITTVALLATLVLLRPIGHLINAHIVHHRRQLRIRLAEGAEPEPVVEFIGAQDGVVIEGLEHHKHDGVPVLEVELRGQAAVDLAEVYGRVSERSDVADVEDPLVS